MYAALLGMIGDRVQVIDIISPTTTPMMDDIHIKDRLLGAVAWIRSCV